MDFESKDDIEAKEQFKKLSFGKKVEYIWDYYKWYFISGILCILILLWALNHYILNPPPGTYTGIAFFDISVTDDEITSLRTSLTNATVPEEENKIVNCVAYYAVEDDPLFEDALLQRLETMLLAKEIDIIIAEEENFKQLSYDGYIVNIDEALSAEELKPFETKNELFYNTNAQDSTLRPYGIKVNNSEYLKNISGFKNSKENIYLGFIRFNTRQEQATKITQNIYKNIK